MFKYYDILFRLLSYQDLSDYDYGNEAKEERQNRPRIFVSDIHMHQTYSPRRCIRKLTTDTVS